MMTPGEQGVQAGRADARAQLGIKPEVVTREFEFAHGKQPRGVGCWAFSLYKGVASGSGKDIFWFNGMYSTAKKAAQAHFAGASAIVVLS